MPLTAPSVTASVTTRIVVVSSSPLVSAGLALALAGVDGWSVEVRPAPEGADVLVLHGIGAESTLAVPPGVPTVLIVDEVHGDDLRDLIGPAVEPRALALLTSQATPPQLHAAVAAVLQGLSVRDAGSSWGSALGPAARADHEPLTSRELEVYELLAKGLSNRDIGGVLGISAHTAKYHVGQILAKVGAATRAEAVGAGLRMGIIGL